MDLFRTRDSGNAGAKLTLMNPATGKDTEHWIRILSIDSDAYQRANSTAMRNTAEILGLPEPQRTEAIESNSLDILVALVSEWSFDTPCTPENVRDFLISAPQIRSVINTTATDRAVFINSNSQPLQPGTDLKPV